MSVAEATEARRNRGLAIAGLFKIEKKGDCWSVPSQRGKTRYAVVLSDKPTCTCEDFANRGAPCKHIFTVQAVAKGEACMPAATVPASSPDRIRDAGPVLRETAAERPTYRQCWPAYNLAQTREKAHFQTLMADLCRGIAEPLRKPGAGRKPAAMRDLAFAAAFKVYVTVSGRRFQTDLDEAHGKGYLSKVIRYYTMYGGFDFPGLEAIVGA